MDRKHLTISVATFISIFLLCNIILGVIAGIEWLALFIVASVAIIGWYSVLLFNTPQHLHDNCQRDVSISIEHKEIDPKKAYIFNVKGASDNYEFEQACRVLNRFYKNDSNIIVNGEVEVTEMRGKDGKQQY